MPLSQQRGVPTTQLDRRENGWSQLMPNLGDTAVRLHHSQGPGMNWYQTHNKGLVACQTMSLVVSGMAFIVSAALLWVPVVAVSSAVLVVTLAAVVFTETRVQRRRRPVKSTGIYYRPDAGDFVFVAEYWPCSYAKSKYPYIWTRLNADVVRRSRFRNRPGRGSPIELSLHDAGAATLVCVTIWPRTSQGARLVAQSIRDLVQQRLAWQTRQLDVTQYLAAPVIASPPGYTSSPDDIVSDLEAGISSPTPSYPSPTTRATAADATPTAAAASGNDDDRGEHSTAPMIEQQRNDEARSVPRPEGAAASCRRSDPPSYAQFVALQQLAQSGS